MEEFDMQKYLELRKKLEIENKLNRTREEQDNKCYLEYIGLFIDKDIPHQTYWDILNNLEK